MYLLQKKATLVAPSKKPVAKAMIKAWTCPRPAVAPAKGNTYAHNFPHCNYHRAFVSLVFLRLDKLAFYMCAPIRGYTS